MDGRLASLITDYLHAVEAAVALLEAAGIPRPRSNVAWAVNGIPSAGELPGGLRYLKLGYGCSVQLPIGIVEFDFGPEGQTNGFDDWRLVVFAGDRLQARGFETEEELLACFRRHVEEGEIFPSGFVLHYLRQA